jgi:hypothetical protein
MLAAQIVIADLAGFVRAQYKSRQSRTWCVQAMQ